LQTAPDASYARPIEELSKFDINDFMKDIRAKVLDKSCFGIKTLMKIYQAMDSRGDCKVEIDDFRWGLLDYGVQITKEEAE